MIKQGIITFTIATLAPGESVEVGFLVTINKDAKKGTTIENPAQVNGADTNTITHYVGAEAEKVVNIYDNNKPKTGDTNNWIGLSVTLLAAGSVLILARKRKLER